MDETKQTKSTTTKSHGPPPNTGGTQMLAKGKPFLLLIK
jgi:hypothetical protein